ncbi:MAG: cytochrome b5-like heme/steroid binding domain-containing protein [bacterium]
MRKERMISLAVLAVAALLLSGVGCIEANQIPGAENTEVNELTDDGSGTEVETEVEAEDEEEDETEDENEDENEEENESEDEDGDGSVTGAAVSVGASGKYSLNEVASHATADDCWMAIDGQVYNVTAAIGNHPGGEMILQGCGKDATQLFATKGRGEAGPPHSPQAREGLANFMIGTLK